MSINSPIVISLVSGKGGVGKTMLSVAVARELSLTNRTLLVDLDFFNRGLTGLMGKGETTCDVDKPAFLLDEEADDTPKWSVTKVAKNLFHIAYPDLLPEEMQRFETLDVNVLKDSLQAFILEASEKCQCECVVLDCHGGPDNSSFAACLFADYSLMVSEPDRITFYGTLNFLRQLKRIGGDQQVNLHLVFNKVVPAFSGLFLRSLYNRLIREHFSGRPLLAIFPLEVYLTKEFEKTPFLTGVYPYSWLAKKTRTLLCDLMVKDHADKLPPSVRAIPKWVRAYTRLSLGKQLPLFNMNVVMLTVVGVVVFLALLALSLSQFFPTQRQRFRNDVARIAMLQCLNKSSLLSSNPDAVKEIMDTPTARDYPLVNEIVKRQVAELRQTYLERDGLLLTNRESPEKLKDNDRVATSQMEKLKELADFKNCALPDAYFPFRLADVADELYPDGFSSRGRYFDYGGRYSDYRGRYLNFYRAKLLLDIYETENVQNQETSNYRVFTKRGVVLNSLKPDSVPKDYLGLYGKSVQNLKNMSLVYLALQTISEVVFSSSGSRALAIAGGGWLCIVLLFTWSGQLDRRFTYYSRLRRSASLMGPYLVAMVLWFLPLLGVAAIIRFFAPYLVDSPKDHWLQMETVLLLAGPIVVLEAGQIIRLYRDLRYERHYLEDLLRAIFLVYFTFGPVALYFLFMRK